MSKPPTLRRQAERVAVNLYDLADAEAWGTQEAVATWLRILAQYLEDGMKVAPGHFRIRSQKGTSAKGSP